MMQLFPLEQIKEIEKAKQFARFCGRLDRITNLLFCGTIVISICALIFMETRDLELSIERSGALLVVLATALSGVLLKRLFAIQSFFARVDPDRPSNLLAVGISRPRFDPTNNRSVDKGSADRQRSQFFLYHVNKKMRTRWEAVLGKVVIWETLLLSLGTLVWGFGDLFPRFWEATP
ncbi:hypothetical protein [Cognatishimia sp. MH4019]|uniref:hypothetical protein n=1 Tax=Cognatishimia sp. MH4019 TaxID=2854030 RepID=UPI001CD5996C|nr:hypothetical protein [Cognatishimia sp. MH4019]